MTVPIDVPARLRAVRRHRVTRWLATIRLGLRMAVHARAKFIGTLLGVVFAAMLANFQLGTMFGLLAKNTLFVDNARADLWVVPPGTTYAQPGQRIAGSLVDRARVTPGVARASGLVMVGTSIARPGGGSEAITLVGVDLGTLLGGPFNLVAGDAGVLRSPDTIIVEDAQRERFGGLNLGSVREVNGRGVRIGGFTWGLLPFGPAYAFAEIDLARELADVPADEVSFVLVELAPGADAGAVAAALATRIPEASVLTRDAFHDRIVRTLLSQQLGITFGVSTVFGLVIGFVIVLLSMYSSVIDNLRELGTLKAIGYTNLDLMRMLVVQAVLYAVVGSVLGLGLVAGAAEGIRSANLSLVIPQALVVMTPPAMTLLCVLASFLAFYRAARLEPGMVFR
ncbi:MAG: ABC transporter permease [Kofleriaceae bacterium]|nr:ABC transporter permease [Kofleriaceae bacterium]